MISQAPIPSRQANTLLLNADFTPLKIIDWERAITLLLEETAELLEGYVDRFVHSELLAMPWPAVLRLKKFVKERTRLRFTRSNVLARDNFTCSYCGKKPTKKGGRPDVEDLTLDHVVPRAQAKNHQVVLPWNKKVVPVTSWDNVASACTSCNSTKAARTPAQAGMTLRIIPRPPTAADILRMTLGRKLIPSEWQSYLPEGAKEWANYWNEPLDED